MDTSVWELIRKPDIYWRLYSPLIERADQIQDVTGGYVLASFDIVDPRQSAKRRIIGEYRLVHQYNYDENPEIHEFYFAGENGFLIENLKFGHSYGYPSTRDLWEFEKWMTVIDSTYALGEELIPIKLDWLGELPYPKGEVMPDNIKFKLED